MLIIATLDHSRRDALVLDQCRQLTRTGSACLLLLHVIPLTRTLLPGIERESDAYLQTVRATLEEEGIETRIALAKGDVASEILRASEEHDADFVVLGTRGRKGWDKLALGSVAETVLTQSRRPVLVVNESMVRAHLEEDVRRKSAYMAGFIWAKQARGEITQDQAELELARLGETDLDRSLLFATYRALDKAEVPADWLDMEFQISTLQQYAPVDVARLGLSPARTEAA